MKEALLNKEAYRRYLSTLKYALYCITHPLDGFWDLTHEKRGSYAAANTILILSLLTQVFSLRFTNFLFNDTYWPKVNIFRYFASILLPLALWCVGNWACTTLFDGKGKLGQIYIATCYAMTPYPLIQIPLIILTNFVTKEEAELVSVISVVSLVWAGFLVLFAMIQVHEYKLSKAILFVIFSVAAMLIIVFIALLFLSMISQGIAYFVSLYKEILFRI